MGGELAWRRAYEGAREALQAKRPEQAIKLYNEAIRLHPTAFDAFIELGEVLRTRGEYQESLICACRAIDLDPSQARAHAMQAVNLMSGRRYDEAADAYALAVRISPDDPDLLFKQGLNLLEAARPAEALEPFQRAFALRPEHKESGLGIALAALAIRDFALGWHAFEIRAKFVGSAIEEPNPERRWRGQIITGKLLVGVEQGIGDMIQFIRFAKPARERCGRLVVQVPHELRTLALTVPGVDAAIFPKPYPTEFEAYIPMLSLPHALGMDPLTPFEIPYMQVPDALLRDAERSLAPFSGERRIGIAWAGNSNYSRDIQRSLPFKLFLDLYEVPGITLVSLQHGPRGDDPKDAGVGALIADMRAVLQTFAHTAALMVHLDLIICCDTSVAHLAGAMGKEVWILVEWNASWRWMIETDDKVWYPKARIFRQRKVGDWEEVMERVVRALCERSKRWSVPAFEGRTDAPIAHAC